MYNTSQQPSHSHPSRSPPDHKYPQHHPQHHQQPLHPSQHPQHHPYAAPSLYNPTISQHPPTPTSLYHPSGHQPGTAPATHYSTHPVAASLSQTTDLLNPAAQRLRSGSGSLVSPELASQDPLNLRRSSSLNDAMANPQTQYYQQMASPMGGYPQQHMYSSPSIPQSNYYQTLPQLQVPSSYVESRPQQMRSVSGSYDYPQHMQYSQGQYPGNTYATSYSSANSMMAPSSASSYSSQAPLAGSPAGMYNMPQRPSPPATLPGAGVHVVDRQKKPQCWDHGCNGREFSTFSNLLRHQREKSGTAAKSYCDHCGAEFTRTTARNGHMEHGKCKTRRAQGSDARSQ